MDIGDLVQRYPTLKSPIIEGILREAETMNLIAASKVGKSWLTIDLAFAVAMGMPWLGFETIKGKVLIIDNELHPQTIAHRLRRVAEARQIGFDQLRGRIDIIHLRGRLQSIFNIGAYILLLPPGSYQLVVIDAQYRTLPADMDENSNGNMAAIYNQIDRYADHLKAGFALVHHATKGDQSQKQITNVGSGAGAQSRAVDAHCIIRPHEENNVFVLDAVCRSWAPVSPRCLRWDFPTFAVDEQTDPTALKSGRGRNGRADDDAKRQAAKQKQDEKEADQESRLLAALDQKADAQGIAGYSLVRGRSLALAAR